MQIWVLVPREQLRVASGRVLVAWCGQRLKNGKSPAKASTLSKYHLWFFRDLVKNPDVGAQPENLEKTASFGKEPQLPFPNQAAFGPSLSFSL